MWHEKQDSPELPPVGHACPGAGPPCSAASAKGPVPGNLALLPGVWLAGEAPRLRLATAGRLMPKAPGAGGAAARPPYAGLHSGLGCWPLFALLACCCMPVDHSRLLPCPGAAGAEAGRTGRRSFRLRKPLTDLGRSGDALSVMTYSVPGGEADPGCLWCRFAGRLQKRHRISRSEFAATSSRPQGQITSQVPDFDWCDSPTFACFIYDVRVTSKDHAFIHHSREVSALVAGQTASCWLAQRSDGRRVGGP